MIKNLARAAALCLAFAAGYQTNRAAQGALNRQAIASVNGDFISRRELNEYLAGYRLTALIDLLEFKVIQQYANSLKVTVSDSELHLENAKTTDKEERYLAERKARGQALLRKIVLRRFSDSKKKQLFQAFLPELTRYTVTVLCLAKPEDEKAFRDQLTSGVSLNDLLAKFSRDIPALDKQHQMKNTDIGTLQGELGDTIGMVVPGLKLGEISHTFASPQGPMIVRLDRKLEEYASLEPYLDALLVDSQRAMLSYQLMAHAVVATDLTIPQGRNWTPQSKAQKLAKPNASATTLPDALPAPIATGAPIPNGIPAVTATGDLSHPSNALPLPQSTGTPVLQGLPKPVLTGAPTDLPAPK